MLRVFVKNERWAILVVYGVIVLGLTVAIVGSAGLVGSVIGHSCGVIPDDSIFGCLARLEPRVFG